CSTARSIACAASSSGQASSPYSIAGTARTRQSDRRGSRPRPGLPAHGAHVGVRVGPRARRARDRVERARDAPATRLHAPAPGPTPEPSVAVITVPTPTPVATQTAETPSPTPEPTVRPTPRPTVAPTKTPTPKPATPSYMTVHAIGGVLYSDGSPVDGACVSTALDGACATTSVRGTIDL